MTSPQHPHDPGRPWAPGAPAAPGAGILLLLPLEAPLPPGDSDVATGTWLARGAEVSVPLVATAARFCPDRPWVFRHLRLTQAAPIHPEGTRS